MAISLMADLLEEMKNHRFAEVHLTMTKCCFKIIIEGDNPKYFSDIEILETSSVPMALKMLRALREGA